MHIRSMIVINDYATTAQKALVANIFYIRALRIRCSFSATEYIEKILLTYGSSNCGDRGNLPGCVRRVAWPCTSVYLKTVP